MKYLLVLMLAVSGWGKGLCKKFPNHPRCPASIEKAKGTDSYCAVFARGKGSDSAGVFLQAFPIAFCDDENQSAVEKNKFLFVAMTGGQWLANADSLGKGFELELTTAEKLELKKSGKRRYLKALKLKKRTKIRTFWRAP